MRALLVAKATVVAPQRQMKVRGSEGRRHLGATGVSTPPRSRPLRQVRFVVAGDPVPQGSKRLGRNRRTGRAMILDDPRELGAWRKAIGFSALRARVPAGIRVPFAGPVMVEAIFWLTKPRSVKRASPWVRPDLDKLVRACLDGITRVLVRDDAQVVELVARKHYVIHDHPTPPGVVILVRELEEER